MRHVCWATTMQSCSWFGARFPSVGEHVSVMLSGSHPTAVHRPFPTFQRCIALSPVEVKKNRGKLLMVATEGRKSARASKL